MSARETARHLLPAALLLFIVLLAFASGWWMGRASRLDLQTESRLARLEGMAAAPRGPGPPGGGPAPAIEIGDSPAAGAAGAPVTIVEFADFECPYCAGAHPTLERVLAEYDGKVRLVFKHNPLPNHPHALLAHRAAVAAHRQGRFWDMHRLLFASQDALDRDALESHARTLGLDLAAFREVLASPESTRAVSADMSLAGRLGVKGVPAFFINGRFLPGAQPFEVFREIIDEALEAEAERRP